MVSNAVIKGWLTGVACPGASQETRNILFHRQGRNCPLRITASILSIIST